MNLPVNSRSGSVGQTRPVSSLGRSGAMIDVHVVDYGAGPKPEFVVQMFERFDRGPDTSHEQGTGLGLSLVTSMMEEMRGSVGYCGVDGRTVFTLRLPAATPTGPPANGVVDAG